MPRRVSYDIYQIEALMDTMNTKQIAEFYGVTENALRIWCHRNKFSLKYLTDYALEEEIKEKTVKEIAYEYRYRTTSVIYSRLKKLGLSSKLQRQLKRGVFYGN